MRYTAVMRIEEDRWDKHPYGIVIKDEDGNAVSNRSFVDSREACYKIASRYGISPKEIEEILC